MPTLRRKDRPAQAFLPGIHDLNARAKAGEEDYYWEPDAATSTAPTATATPMMNDDEIKPNDELNLVKKKKRRSLTVPLEALGDGGNGLASMLSSIGLNIPS